MPVQLVSIDKNELGQFQYFQQESFRALYEKYQDKHSPYLESRERIAEKFQRDSNVFYWICKGNEKVGCLRLVLNQETKSVWALHPKTGTQEKHFMRSFFCTQQEKDLLISVEF